MTTLRTTILLVVLYYFGTISGAPVDDAGVNNPQVFADEDYRLPTIILPIQYNISLRPYLLSSDESSKRFTFDGEVFITINATEATTSIVLHSKNLNYSTREYWATSNVNQKIDLTSFTFNNVTDKLTYTLSTSLVKNATYVLHFVYNGTMDDDMHGFYKSNYIDSNNTEQWIGSTQFQTNHARRAFPSFDEPYFKAVFNVNITRHKDMNSFANTRPLQTGLPSGITDYEIDVYTPTPKMSTYLLAFIVSKFSERINTENNFGVISRPEYYNQTVYSQDVGSKILNQLNTYFNKSYYEMGNDKMHMAAIPDFSAGAMENWGLLTYRERALLYEEGETTLSAKQSIAAVIAHEQTHMWFGDLVTCKWWSYTWLNEGFARYFQYYGTAMVEDKMYLDLQFPVDQVQSVMGLDSINSTNPMSDENTNSPDDLSRMFNTISYNKGASFIRMTKHVMGETNFQKSLQEYLDTYAYQNTVPENLFEVWEKYFPENFKNLALPFFESFTEQVGYPLITINLNTNGNSFEISQNRFLLKSEDGSNASLLYTVPISYTTNSSTSFDDTTPKLFLNATSEKQNVSLNSPADWIIANIQQTGFYRVNYDESNWHKIHHKLFEDNWGGIHELNRAQVVDDLLNLARASVIEYDLALAILEYLETETNYLPWTSAFNGYSYLAIRLGVDTAHFATYINQLTEKAYKQLDFAEKDTDTALDIYARAKILSWSCKYGNSDCISKAKTYFQNIENSTVPVNIRSPVYCTALREGTEADFDKLFNKYETSQVATEQTLILNTLGCVKDSNLVEKYYKIILGDKVRRQDKSSALSGLYTENNENVSPVFNLINNDVDALANALGSYSSVATVISNIAARFTEDSQKQDLEKFIENHGTKFGSSVSTLNAAVKTVNENLDWSAKKLGVFKQYLQNRNGGAALKAFASLSLFIVTFVLFILH